MEFLIFRLKLIIFSLEERSMMRRENARTCSNIAIWRPRYRPTPSRLAGKRFLENGGGQAERVEVVRGIIGFSSRQTDRKK
jgi:hypothetical protein